MNCNKVQELLMTDYLDGELKPENEDGVKKHLETCSQCKAFEQTLRQNVVEPFKNLEEIQPPPSVWTKIHATITEEEQKKRQGEFNWLDWLKEKLNLIFLFPRPAYTLATICVIAILVTTFMPKTSVKTAEIDEYLIEQAEFLGGLDSEHDFIELGTWDESI